MIENSAGWRYVQSADPVADYPTVSEHNAGKFQDLKSIVSGKAPLTHTHPQSQVTGLDAALDGKAPLTHTHSTSQVTGLDTALAGKAPLTTLDTRVPENLALRLDTTVGTRIFAGDTMIHGDTGWRTLVSWDTAGNITYGAMPQGMDVDSGKSGGIWIRRVRERVTLAISGAIGTSISAAIDLPIGFFPKSAPRPTLLFAVSTGVGSASIGNGKAYTGWSVGVKIPSSSSSVYAAMITWDVFDTWPTSLPGLPL